ncbi:MAG: hypothetical protein KDA44_11445 [Planctomycetales bacterium]|nr:hypothetical protein [Planctomycetales bacterium]
MAWSPVNTHATLPESRGSRSFVVRALAVAMIVAATATVPSRAGAEEGPQIVGLQLGFNGSCKLGCWTQAEVTLLGGDKPLTGVLQVTAEDADGVPAATISPPTRAVGVQPGVETTARVFLRPGKSGGAITVRFLVDGKPAATETFRPALEPNPRQIKYPLAATNELIVLAGPAAGIGELIRSDSSDNEQAATIASRLKSVEQLPLEWYGYEGVSTVILTTSEPEFYRPLAQNPQRVEALLQWIERGGKLVLFCGSAAEELLGDGGPLAPFVPGEFAGMAPLRETAPLDNFIITDESLNRGRIDIRVPQIDGVVGQVLAYGGRTQRDLPLVVRTRRGLGEITFVAVDPESPPIANWSARPAFLRRALGWRARTAADDQAAAALSQGSGYPDLTNQLRGALDARFVGVTPAPFGLVALLVVLYIALIGPGDYFFVKRVLKRMELTWVTFPTAVVATSLAAYWLANYYKGDQLRINQVEIVDVDVARNMARGTVWTHLFNPRVQRYDFQLAPRFAGADVVDAERLVGWLGLAGDDLGGMQGAGSQAPDLRPSYEFAPDLSAMLDLPVPEWSTKSLTARWTGAVAPAIAAQLTLADDELVEGRIENRSSLPWDACVLLHGRWAYRLSPIPPGGSVDIGPDLRPTTIKTRLTAASAGDDAVVGTGDDGTVEFDSLGGDVARIAKLMMFYDAIGGSAYASTLNRYQGFVDMSDLLAGDQAVLLVRVETPGSQWLRDDEALESGQDRRWTFYRFVIPLDDSGD